MKERKANIHQEMNEWKHEWARIYKCTSFYFWSIDRLSELHFSSMEQSFLGSKISIYTDKGMTIIFMFLFN